jgi:multidrug efflux pump subunit AcrA (membrane-fusion protein)
MKKRNVIVLIVGGVLILAGIGYWIFRSQNNTNSTRYITGQATKGTLTVSVSGTGNVIVGTSAKISPTISGTVQDLAVAQGDHVTKGEKLFLIQNDQLDTTVQKSYVSYLQSKQALTNAQAAVTNAQTNYNNVVKDSGQTKAQSALDQAELQLSTDQATLAKYQADNLATSGTHSDSDIALLEQKISLDQSNVDAAQVALDQSNASAGANILVAQKQLSAAEQGATIAQKNVENALADYNTQKTNAALRTVTAPIDGTLTTLSVSNGDTIGNASTGSSSSSANSSTSSSTSRCLPLQKATLRWLFYSS